MDKFKEMRKMYKDAGVSVYAFKPSTFGTRNTDAEINYGFNAAKALGASHVTLELPEDPSHSLKLGQMAAKHKMYVAYHGHLQQTPTAWDTALEQSDNNAMNLDLGHYVAAGNPSPLDLINAKHERIMSMHVKDRQNLENGSTLIGIQLSKRTGTFTRRIGRNNAAMLPYPVLIENGKAKILDPKYYIAYMYPMLQMSEFMTIATIPDAMIKDCEKVFK